MMIRKLFYILVLGIILVPVTLLSSTTSLDNRSEYEFEDRILDEELKYPDWFKPTFGDLREDHKDVLTAEKQGLIIYFGQKRCSYCERFLKNNLESPQIKNYIQKHFDVIPVDIWGVEEIITMEGEVLAEREFAILEETNFTPSLLIYNREGEVALRMRGYYPPYKFAAALKYVVEGYYKKESLRDYMARADPAMVFDPEGLNDEDFFSQPPFVMDRSRFRGQKPLVVFFEQGKCHACDVLHTSVLAEDSIRRELNKMEVVQLDMWGDTPVITPGGEKTTARKWASELGLYYAPALVFFDENGKELMRVDAVTQFYRLLGVLDYINRRGYEEYPNYQQWRITRRDIAR